MSSRVAVQTQDDAFHEIQLNGKQLVFLFMAATVVSVVIFLCGVLVGRGVRVERAPADGTLTQIRPADPVPTRTLETLPPTAGSDPSKAVARDVEAPSYIRRLEQRTEPAADLKPQPAPKQNDGTGGRPASSAASSAGQKPPADVGRGANTSEASHPAAAPPVRQAAKTSPDVSDAVSTPGPPGPGYAVQIAALNVRSEADTIARRLTAKGYNAFVLAPATGTPQVYRVRIGTFKTRREAESVAAKLQKEESVKPWVTR